MDITTIAAILVHMDMNRNMIFAHRLLRNHATVETHLASANGIGLGNLVAPHVLGCAAVQDSLAGREHRRYGVGMSIALAGYAVSP